MTRTLASLALAVALLLVPARAQLAREVHHLGVAQVRHVLLEGQPQDQHAARPAHLVVDAAGEEDDQRQIHARDGDDREEARFAGDHAGERGTERDEER